MLIKFENGSFIEDTKIETKNQYQGNILWAGELDHYYGYRAIVVSKRFLNVYNSNIVDVWYKTKCKLNREIM